MDDFCHCLYKINICKGKNLHTLKHKHKNIQIKGGNFRIQNLKTVRSLFKIYQVNLMFIKQSLFDDHIPNIFPVRNNLQYPTICFLMKIRKVVELDTKARTVLYKIFLQELFCLKNKYTYFL